MSKEMNYREAAEELGNEVETLIKDIMKMLLDEGKINSKVDPKTIILGGRAMNIYVDVKKFIELSIERDMELQKEIEEIHLQQTKTYDIMKDFIDTYMSDRSKEAAHGSKKED